MNPVAACGCPDAYRGARLCGVGWFYSSRGKRGDWHLDRDGMYVEALERVNARCVRSRNEVEMLKWSKCSEVEYRAEVDIESVGTLAGEDLRTVAESVYRRTRQARIVGGRSGPHVYRWRWEITAENHESPSGLLLDRILLTDVPVGIGEGADLTSVV